MFISQTVVGLMPIDINPSAAGFTFIILFLIFLLNRLSHTLKIQSFCWSRSAEQIDVLFRALWAPH